jgi:hypothetical protein
MFFKRSKIFLHSTSDGVNVRFSVGVSNQPVQVPEWVTETLTYKHGVRDGSILDLTLPAAKPTKKQIEAEVAATADQGGSSASKEGSIDDEPVKNDDVDDTDNGTDDEGEEGSGLTSVAPPLAPVTSQLPTETPKGLRVRQPKS